MERRVSLDSGSRGGPNSAAVMVRGAVTKRGRWYALGMLKRLAACAVLVTVLASCAPSVLDARLYDLEGGEVLHATFTYSNTTRGQVSFEGRGDRLEGEYVTVREGTTSWGEIFGLYYSGGSQETALRGSAVAVSVLGTGWLVECEYVTTGAHGHGACRDNRGGRYRLLY